MPTKLREREETNTETRKQKREQRGGTREAISVQGHHGYSTPFKLPTGPQPRVPENPDRSGDQSRWNAVADRRTIGIGLHSVAWA